jgi:hypothetical protein
LWAFIIVKRCTPPRGKSLKDYTTQGGVQIPTSTKTAYCPKQELLNKKTPKCEKAQYYWTFRQTKKHPPTKFLLSIDGFCYVL